jgi:hypothetical protein
MVEKINEQLNNGNIDIEFNEFLWIHGATDILYVNKDINHFHFDNDIVAIKKWLLDIAEGKIVFLEDTSKFSLKMFNPFQPWGLKIISRDEFEDNKDKLLAKKHLRIYTGNEIIKR